MYVDDVDMADNLSFNPISDYLGSNLEESTGDAGPYYVARSISDTSDVDQVLVNIEFTDLRNSTFPIAGGNALLGDMLHQGGQTTPPADQPLAKIYINSNQIDINNIKDSNSPSQNCDLLSSSSCNLSNIVLRRGDILKIEFFNVGDVNYDQNDFLRINDKIQFAEVDIFMSDQIEYSGLYDIDGSCQNFTIL
jgi:hypothetical protein